MVSSAPYWLNLYRKYLFSANHLFSFSCFNVYLCLGNIFECFVALGRKTKGMQWFDFNEKKKIIIKQMIHCFYFLLDLVSRQLQVRLANSLQHRINDKWYIPGGQSLCVDFLYITYEFYFFSNCYILSYSNSILKGIFSFLLASSLRQPNTILLQSTNNRIHCF